MSAARDPRARPSLLDAALFPDVLPVLAPHEVPRETPDEAPDAKPDARPGASSGAEPGARGAARWARAVGAFLFWGVLAQGIFILPGRLPEGPDAPLESWYRPLIPPVWATVVNVVVAAGFVWWFVLRPSARRDARRRATFRLRPLARPAWSWAALAALAAAVGVNAALLVLPRATRLPPREPLIELYTRLPNGSLALAALAVLVAPLLEEFFFRGWAQGALERRMAAWPAILVTAVTFAALHGLDAFGLVPRLALATAAGYAAWATQSIWPGVALHGAYNASLFVGGALLPALLPKPPRTEAWADADRAAFFYWAHDPRVFWPALVVLALATAGAAWALRRMADAARADGRAE